MKLIDKYLTYIVYIFFFIVASKNYAISNNIETDKNILIQGKIIDASTNEIIPYCSIVNLKDNVGTSSNDDGEFELRVKSLPIEIMVSHIGYQKQKIKVGKNNRNILIKITPLSITLDEVAVEKKTFSNPYAVTLAKRAYNRTLQLSRKTKYGKAYYRQKSKNNEDYTELSEIIYDVKFTTEGIIDWDIIEGRYALKKEKVNNKNYTLFSKIFKSVQFNTDDLILPLNKNMEDLYRINIVEKIKSRNGKINVLSFVPIHKKNAPIVKAEVFINEKTNEVLKVVGTIRNNNLNFVKLSDKDAYAKDQIIEYELAFKKSSSHGLVIDYLKVDQEFDYYVDNALKTRMATTSNLFFYEYNTPKKKKKLGKQFKKDISDWEKLDKLGYNKEFWKNNPIIKRTPVEKEVIEAFEKDNAFESIFLNSRGQVLLLQTKISKDTAIVKINEILKDKITKKLYIHTNKDNFSAGEKIWFAIYDRTTTNKKNTYLDERIYVDIIDSNNKTIASQEYVLNSGNGSGSIKIPSNSPDGEYTMRAYSNWMKNFDKSFFFNKKIKIGTEDRNTSKTVDNKVSMTFYPEGGYLIANLRTRIAFKALGKDGTGRKVTGYVKDQNNNRLMNFKSIENGMGNFSITPKKGNNYTVILENGQSFALPPVTEEGFSIFVDNINDYTIKLVLQATKKYVNEEFYIIGTSQNKKYFQGKFNFSKSSSLKTEIPKFNLPNGVFTITVFDKNVTPLCERSVFINNRNKLKITAKTKRKKFSKKDRIELAIKIMDNVDIPVQTNFSISVTQIDENEKKDKNNKNGTSYFYLESDSKGLIQEPTKYSKDNSRVNKFKTDLLMMANDWRRIDWKNNNEKKYNFNENSAFTLDELDDILDTVDEPDNTNQQNTKTTQYWNPNVKTNKKGKATVVFNNNGKAKKIKICIETLSKKGIPGSYSKILTSKK